MPLNEGEAFLSDLPEGGSGTIARFTGPTHFTRRALHMGIRPGQQVKVIQKMGFHILIELGSCRMGLGRHAAFKIVVKKGE